MYKALVNFNVFEDGACYCAYILYISGWSEKLGFLKHGAYEYLLRYSCAA